MAVIALPAIYMRVRRYDIDVPGQANRSEWTSTRQYVGLPGAETWYGHAAFLPVSREREKRLLRSFLLRLDGQLNSFKLPMAPGQHAGPNPTVSAIVSPNSVTLSSAAGLHDGMFATIISNGKGRLVVLTADPSGNTITFKPRLRVNPVGGSTVEIMNPYSEVVLLNPRNGFDDDEGVQTLEFDVEEA